MSTSKIIASNKPEKRFGGQTGFEAHGLYVMVAVLYQLSYEDPCQQAIIYWVHLDPWKE